MVESCPTCARPFGQRRRCYYCHGSKKTGETRACQQCGSEFYVQPNQARDTARNQGTYCSNKCKHKAMSAVMKTRRPTAERYMHTAGYILILTPDHPRADSKGRVLEHILVKEREIGRPITRAEEVHHLDGDKANNDPKNLILLSQTDHARLHAWMQRVGHQPMQKRKVSAAAI